MSISKESPHLEEKIIEDFMNALRRNILYWDHISDLSTAEKLEGCTHSILCMLDGVSGAWNGNIKDLIDDSFMLHDKFFEEKNDN